MVACCLLLFGFLLFGSLALFGSLFESFIVVESVLESLLKKYFSRNLYMYAEYSLTPLAPLAPLTQLRCSLAGPAVWGKGIGLGASTAENLARMVCRAGKVGWSRSMAS